MLRMLFAYLAAVAVTYVTASIAHTQSVMGRLLDMDVPVTLGDRLHATVHDVVGMAASFLPLLALALAIAFPVAGLAIRRLPRWRPVGYSVAGGVAVLVLHLTLSLVFQITPVAGARTTLGLTVQALCGGLGGWVFRICLAKPAARCS